MAKNPSYGFKQIEKRNRSMIADRLVVLLPLFIGGVLGAVALVLKITGHNDPGLVVLLAAQVITLFGIINAARLSYRVRRIHTTYAR